jgi:PKD domain/FG-GAP-like repeat
MRPKSWGVLSILVGMVFAVSLAASALAGDGVFAVVSNSNPGDAFYLVSQGNGEFDSPQVLQLTGNTDISLPYKNSYGNALGDFDKDGDLDYVTGLGFKTGSIYISLNEGKIAVNEGQGDSVKYKYQFADPVSVATWAGLEGEKCYAGGMAAADFNEDGIADFVMAPLKSAVMMVYLSNTTTNTINIPLEFTSVTLTSGKPANSFGVDTADFNNDGHADFIVAPGNSPDKYYFYLGDGTGNFVTYTFNPADGEAVSGVAAADFDRDGLVDFAAVNEDSLYVYKGKAPAEGAVSPEGAVPPVDFESEPAVFAGFEFSTQPAIDNFDFNGDGWQDLVVAGYGPGAATESGKGVAVLLGGADLGDGQKGFTVADLNQDGQADIYPCESKSSLLAVAAPPYEPNQPPVAVIKIMVAGQEVVSNPPQVMAGQKVEFVGTDSSDPDADASIATYLWDFGDQTSSDGSFDRTYYDANDYTVSLTVTDDKGAFTSVSTTFKVVPVPVTVKFSPNPLDLKSRDKWVLATIKVPDGMEAARIARDSITLGIGTSDIKEASQEYRHTFLAKLWRKIWHRMNVAAVKFNRQAVVQAIGGPNDNAVLAVKGKIFVNGGLADFAGAGSIKACEKFRRWGFLTNSFHQGKF